MLAFHLIFVVTRKAFWFLGFFFCFLTFCYSNHFEYVLIQMPYTSDRAKAIATEVMEDWQKV